MAEQILQHFLQRPLGRPRFFAAHERNFFAEIVSAHLVGRIPYVLDEIQTPGRYDGPQLKKRSQNHVVGVSAIVHNDGGRSVELFFELFQKNRVALVANMYVIA